MGKPPQVRRRLLKDVRNVDTIEENVLLDKKKKKNVFPSFSECFIIVTRC